jgi:hypothetical protein
MIIAETDDFFNGQHRRGRRMTKMENLRNFKNILTEKVRIFP